MTTEIVLMWIAVTLYAASAILFTAALVFDRPAWSRIALGLAVLGTLPHLAGIGVRWARTGHGPYLGFYEVVSSYALASAAVLGFIAWRRPGLRSVGAVLMPIAFLMLGAAMFSPKSELEITGTLASWWLGIHVAFAGLAYGAFVGAFAVAGTYLRRDRAAQVIGEPAEAVTQSTPEVSQSTLDVLQFRLVAVGFAFLGIMIVSGAVWANEAWGRYWGWDPIETWSLISWLVYAGYLHTRFTLGWKGRRSARFAMLALPVVVFALIGVPIVYRSIHSAYLVGY